MPTRRPDRRRRGARHRASVRALRGAPGGRRQPAARRAAGGGATSAVDPGASVAAVGGGFRVNGELEADAVVVAMPAPALAGIEFTPPLPGVEGGRHGRVGVRHAAKLAVPLTWLRRGPAPCCRCPGSSGRGRRLTATAGWRQWSPRSPARRRRWPRSRSRRPRTAIWSGCASCAPTSRWTGRGGAGDVAGGRLSTREPGRRVDEDEALSRPVGRIAFAGEHTRATWYGTMEGALRSGVRAAHDLLTG